MRWSWINGWQYKRLPNCQIHLQDVRKLLRHEAFDIKNPNKVYALIGHSLAVMQCNFHADDGEGYAFLREVVHQLDKLNPQVAAEW